MSRSSGLILLAAGFGLAALPALAQEEVVEENMSNRAASDAATDRAYSAAQANNPPVVNTVEAARAAAETAGAVGAAAFRPETFDPVIVAIGILSSDLETPEKVEMLEHLSRALEGDDVAAMLASIRTALLIES